MNSDSTFKGHLMNTRLVRLPSGTWVNPAHVAQILSYYDNSGYKVALELIHGYELAVATRLTQDDAQLLADQVAKHLAPDAADAPGWSPLALASHPRAQHDRLRQERQAEEVARAEAEAQAEHLATLEPR